jgi:acyl-CoA dehydrogenase
MMWRSLRMLRLADGPDEVHKMVIALRELNRWRAAEPPAEPESSQPPAAVGAGTS